MTRKFHSSFKAGLETTLSTSLQNRRQSPEDWQLPWPTPIPLAIEASGAGLRRRPASAAPRTPGVWYKCPANCARIPRTQQGV